MLRVANAIAVIGLTALLAVTGLVLVDIVLRSGPVLALLDRAPALAETLRRMGADGLSDLYAPLGIVAVAACFPAMLATRSAITVRFVAQALPWRGREMLEALGAVSLLAMFALMAWWLSDYTRDLWQSGETTWLLMIPRWPAFAVASFCLWAGVAIQSVVAAHQVVRAFSRTEPPPLPQIAVEME
ncbi:MAG: TRAP transporter small permease subunit [Paracoccus sp. (in: a-proteobacteria)]|nr:TRAP transporter small permease subunit [Paracoccus sp. (in: a-proteobacteria)]